MADTHLAWNQLSRAADYAEMQQLAQKAEQAAATKMTRFGTRFHGFMAVRLFLRTCKICESFYYRWIYHSFVHGMNHRQ